jgi:glycosyltransferase involved in cell wall biosynthesis
MQKIKLPKLNTLGKQSSVDIEGYIPKDQRKTILMLSDDIRTQSGVGGMAREIVLNTAHQFNWVNLGGAVKHPESGKGFDLSHEVNNLRHMPDSSVKVIACDGYGNQDLLRQMIANEKPDAIVHFTDPRYWVWLYQMENEIRQKCPLIFYTIWDDLPYPMWNREFYRSDDMLLCISKQTKNLVENVLRDHPKPGKIQYVPHGIDEKKYFPVVNNFEFESFKERILEGERDFVILHVSRNIRRKNQSDIILAWRTFLDQLPVEKAKRCILLMKTEPSFDAGTDLPAVIDSLCDPEIHKVKIINERFDDKNLNYLYNCSDAHMFMTDNEGWGLGLTESLTAGRMIIAPVQGGMQDQMRFEDENGDWINFSTEHPSNADGKYKKCGEWAMPIFPKTRSVKGSPQTPYIFASQCSIEDAAITLMKVYKMSPEERQRRGLAGREWVLSDESGFTAKRMGQGFIDNINNLLEEWEPQPRFTVTKVDNSTKLDNYNPNPISLTPEFIKEIQSI